MLNREKSLYILAFGIKSRCENLVDGVSRFDDDHDILFHFLFGLIINSLEIMFLAGKQDLNPCRCIEIYRGVERKSG